MSEQLAADALSLPTGMAIRLRADLDQLIQDLLTVVPRSFVSGEYPQEKQRIEESFEQRRKLALVSLSKAAEQDGIVILDTPTGYTLAPLADGKPMPQEVFNQLPENVHHLMLCADVVAAVREGCFYPPCRRHGRRGDAPADRPLGRRGRRRRPLPAGHRQRPHPGGARTVCRRAEAPCTQDARRTGLEGAGR